MKRMIRNNMLKSIYDVLNYCEFEIDGVFNFGYKIGKPEFTFFNKHVKEIQVGNFIYRANNFIIKFDAELRTICGNRIMMPVINNETFKHEDNNIYVYYNYMLLKNVPHTDKINEMFVLADKKFCWVKHNKAQ